MKRFFFTHPSLTELLIYVVVFLPTVAGSIIPLVLDTNGGILFLGGLGLSLCLALIGYRSCSFQCFTEAIETLRRLRQSRRVFHAPYTYSSIAEAETDILQNLSHQKTKRSYRPLHHTQTVTCKGIWQKDVKLYQARSSNLPYPTHYLLYTTDLLDKCTWKALQVVIDKQLLELETESIGRVLRKAAYAICILCNEADPELTASMQQVQAFQITDAHVCIGVIPQNNWYLPAYCMPQNDSFQLARTLLGKATFGFKYAVFPYADNDAYTDAYCETLERLCNTPWKETVNAYMQQNQQINR